jgi:hypothetical protein
MIKKITLLFFVYLIDLQAYRAVIVTPVADLLGCYAEDIGQDYSVYFALPYSPEIGRFSCVRIHQALFNEVVEVEEERDQECKIRHNGAWYAKGNTLCNEFYTLRNFLIPLDETLEKTVPSMFDKNQAQGTYLNHTVALVDSFTTMLPEGPITFSAGTRFKIYENCEDCYVVYCLHSVIKIPKALCLIHLLHESHEDRIDKFVSVLKLWASHPKEFVPYVWGGTSKLHGIEEGSPFELIQDQTKSFWRYPSHDYTTKSGMDCSSMILRAAQIANLPYFYKNTTTCEMYLHDFTSYGFEIQRGDIIWFKGHVIVISDVEKNTCIEARGYSSGFGRVHEIDLKNLFDEINTVDDLKDAFINNKKLILLDKSGQKSKVIEVFKILKLKSIFTKL